LLSNLTIKNFRKFDQFSLRFRSGNVLVGPNNAGKSSILDAFRILEPCLRHTKTKSPTQMSISGHGVVSGYVLPDTVFPFDSRNVSRNYNSDPTIFEFTHTNKNKLFIEIFEDSQARMYLVVSSGKNPKTSTNFRSAFPVDVILIPTLSPLEADEKYVKDETVRRNAQNRRASGIFRNIWLRRSPEQFESFRQDIEEGWPGIKIEPPTNDHSRDGLVTMFFQEDRIAREVQWAGFGFQVWLQIHTHLRRQADNPILVIDEPDVYLHPDLQRRLFHIIKRRMPQFIMATHATEIINEADADEIVSINHNYKNAKRITTDEDLALLHKYIGSNNNIDYARIAKARKIIFVEGNDEKILRKIAARFGFSNLADAQGIPIVQLGGFSERRRAQNAVWTLKDILKLDVSAFCLLDRDYRCDEEVELIANDATPSSVPTWILKRKEIENYLLSPRALTKAVQKRLSQREAQIPISVETVIHIMIECAGPMKYDIAGQLSAHTLRHFTSNRSPIDSATLISNTQLIVDEKLKDVNNLVKIIPGKQFLARLNDHLQEKYSISITVNAIIDAMDKDSTDGELIDLLTTLNDFCAQAL